jgi:guanylate kinase
LGIRGLKRGLLVVISGPSGVGKDTVIKRLLELDSNLVYSVSGTTRQPRKGEKPDENYTFLTRPEFERLVEQGAFLEHATYNGNLYGTFRERVEKARDQGRDMVLKIDVEGADQVRRIMPGAILIFVVAPSEEALRERQERRGSESPQDLESRRQIAEREMSQSGHYDHVVTNDDVDRAAREILEVIRRARASQT